MENYNLTAELKKIASGITTSDPNTELGNINSGVGNLDTAMQGVATAINGISIPNPGSNIDGVATAIGNISIPNPGTNIDGVATAVDNLAGGKDLGDIETILTTINGNIANLGSNHITTIEVSPLGPWYMMHYADGHVAPLPNAANKTAYTDTNNIGATDVQSAVDTLSDKSYGTATLNATYVSQGSVTFQKIGKVVTVFISDVRFRTQPPDGTATAFATGLPRSSSNMSATAVILLHPWAAAFTRDMRVALSPNSTALNFNYSAISVPSTTSYYATFSYVAE